MSELTSEQKRKKIRAYFAPESPNSFFRKPEGFIDLILILIGIAVMIFFILISFGLAIPLIFSMMKDDFKEKREWEKLIESWGLTKQNIQNKPDASQIDAWLAEDMQTVTDKALYKLGLTQDQLVREPLVIYGPLLWSTYGIPDDEITSKLADDNQVRFSCYQLVVVMLSEERIATYSADFNFMRYAFTNERGVEFLYQDIVSVSTEEKSTNYDLPNGKTMKRAEIFRLAVSSGDNIEVVVNSREIKDLLGGEPKVSSHEQNVRVIREMLRDKKRVR